MVVAAVQVQKLGNIMPAAPVLVELGGERYIAQLVSGSGSGQITTPESPDDRQNPAPDTPNLPGNTVTDDAFPIQINYYAGRNSRNIRRTCSNCYFSMLLTITILFDLLICIILRTLKWDALNPVKHPNWNPESIFLIATSSSGLGATFIITYCVLTKTKIHSKIFNWCLIVLGLVAICDVIWIISEQQERRNVIDETGLLPSDAKKAHRPISVLHQIKVFEIVILTIVSLIWIRAWHERDGSELWLARRVRRNTDCEARHSNNLDKTLQGVKVEIKQDLIPELSGGEPDQFGCHKGLYTYQSGRPRNTNKTAQNEFREMGDGIDNGTAQPRVLV